MKFATKFVCKTTDEKGWEHFAWIVTINGTDFDYRMGIAHCDKFKRPTPPDQKGVLECLFSDARAGEMSFDDFCAELGYDNDSISALDVYRACMETRTRLRKALGAEFAKLQEEIEAQQSA